MLNVNKGFLQQQIRKNSKNDYTADTCNQSGSGVLRHRDVDVPRTPDAEEAHIKERHTKLTQVFALHSQSGFLISKTRLRVSAHTPTNPLSTLPTQS
jgi:hypothetical protein